MIPQGKKPKQRYERVRPFWQFHPFDKENSYEIPLLEFIVRKGWGRKNKLNIGRYNPIIHRRDYKPSSAYVRYISKFHPLHKVI